MGEASAGDACWLEMLEIPTAVLEDRALCVPSRDGFVVIPLEYSGGQKLQGTARTLLLNQLLQPRLAISSPEMHTAMEANGSRGM